MKPWLILAVVILGLLATAIVISNQEQLMVAARAVRQALRKAVAAITQAAHAPKADVHITLTGKIAGAVSLQERAGTLPTVTDGDTIDLLLAVTESDLSSNVSRGENAARRLNHRTVVRLLGLIGSAEARQGTSFSAESTVTLAKGWKPEKLRAVAILQERKSRRVIGAGAVKLTGD